MRQPIKSKENPQGTVRIPLLEAPIKPKKTIPLMEQNVKYCISGDQHPAITRNAADQNTDSVRAFYGEPSDVGRTRALPHKKRRHTW